MSPARLAVLAITLVAAAGPATASAGSCTIDATIGVAFGSYDVFDSAPLDSVGSLDYRCTDVDASDRITIELGTGLAGSYAPRAMRAGADELSYNLFLDASRMVVFGDGTSGTSRVGPSAPPEDEPVTVFVYGRVPARQDAHVGAYADTVVVTITF